MNKQIINGEKLRILRENRGYTLAQMAESLNALAREKQIDLTFTRQSIQHWEKGRNSARRKACQLIAEYLEVNMEMFMENSYTNENKEKIKQIKVVELKDYQILAVIKLMNAVQKHYRAIRDGYIDHWKDVFFGNVPYNSMIDAPEPFDVWKEKMEEHMEDYNDFVLYSASLVLRIEPPSPQQADSAVKRYAALKKTFEETYFQLPPEIADQFFLYLKEARRVRDEGMDYFADTLNLLDEVREKQEYINVMNHVLLNDRDDFVRVYSPDLLKLQSMMRDLRYYIAGPCCRNGKVELSLEEDYNNEDSTTEENAEGEGILYADYV